MMMKKSKNNAQEEAKTKLTNFHKNITREMMERKRVRLQFQVFPFCPYLSSYFDNLFVTRKRNE